MRTVQYLKETHAVFINAESERVIKKILYIMAHVIIIAITG